MDGDDLSSESNRKSIFSQMCTKLSQVNNNFKVFIKINKNIVFFIKGHYICMRLYEFAWQFAF